MESTDITVQILREIRDQISQTNARVEQHIGETHKGFGDLRRAMAESEVRTATTLTAVAGTLSDIKHLLADRLEVRDRVDRCEREIELIKNRLAG